MKSLNDYNLTNKKLLKSLIIAIPVLIVVSISVAVVASVVKKQPEPK